MLLTWFRIPFSLECTSNRVFQHNFLQSDLYFTIFKVSIGQNESNGTNPKPKWGLMRPHILGVFVPRARRTPSRTPSRGSSRALRVVHALLLLPCVFWNFPNFSINADYVPKPYSTPTARISSRLPLQLYRSPYYDSNKPYFITYYAV